MIQRINRVRRKFSGQYRNSPWTKVSIALWCFLPQIIVIAIILLVYEGECDTPVRTWLRVYLTLIIVFTFIMTTVGCVMAKWRYPRQLPGIQSWIIIGFGIVWLVWFIIGNDWYYSDDEWLDFYAGHALTLVILSLHYTVLGIIVCGAVFGGVYLICKNCPC